MVGGRGRGKPGPKPHSTSPRPRTGGPGEGGRCPSGGGHRPGGLATPGRVWRLQPGEGALGVSSGPSVLAPRLGECMGLARTQCPADPGRPLLAGGLHSGGPPSWGSGGEGQSGAPGRAQGGQEEVRGCRPSPQLLPGWFVVRDPAQGLEQRAVMLGLRVPSLSQRAVASLHPHAPAP